MLQDSQVLMGLYGPDDRLCQANAAFLAAYQIRLEDEPTWESLLRDNYAHKRGVALSTTDFEAWLAATRSRRRRQPFRAFESDHWDGRWLWITETLQPDGWLLYIATDITDLKASEHAMRHARDQALAAANTDALTGIGSRSYVLEQLLERLGDGAAEPLCVAVVDLDRFKNINDSLGHPVGDLVLQDFALRAQALMQGCGMVGRIGGEEFMLLLPAFSLPRAEQLIEQLHVQVRLARPVAAWPHRGYTFSAGLAQARGDDSMDAVFRRADRALYLAKKAGRNRTMRAED